MKNIQHDYYIDRSNHVTTYMEKHDDQSNTHKFYMITQCKEVICYQWGRIGTKGSSLIKIYQSEDHAYNSFNEKENEKVLNHYSISDNDSLIDLPDGNLTFINALKKHQAEHDESSGYYLQWEATKPLTSEAIKAAAALTKKVIGSCECFTKNAFDVNHNSVEGYMEFTWEPNHECGFGFPPQSFLDSLSSRERKAVEELGTSRDGWLAKDGTGKGVIVTDKELIDFPIRLFLSILVTKNDLKVSCTDDMGYEENGLIVTNLHSDFDWYQHWDQIKPIVEEHWFLQGSTKVIFNNPESQSEPNNHYAW